MVLVEGELGGLQFTLLRHEAIDAPLEQGQFLLQFLQQALEFVWDNQPLSRSARSGYSAPEPRPASNA